MGASGHRLQAVPAGLGESQPESGDSVTSHYLGRLGTPKCADPAVNRPIRAALGEA